MGELHRVVGPTDLEASCTTQSSTHVGAPGLDPPQQHLQRDSDLGKKYRAQEHLNNPMDTAPGSSNFGTASCPKPSSGNVEAPGLWPLQPDSENDTGGVSAAAEASTGEVNQRSHGPRR